MNKVVFKENEVIDGEIVFNGVKIKPKMDTINLEIIG